MEPGARQCSLRQPENRTGSTEPPTIISIATAVAVRDKLTPRVGNEDRCARSSCTEDVHAAVPITIACSVCVAKPPGSAKSSTETTPGTRPANSATLMPENSKAIVSGRSIARHRGLLYRPAKRYAASEANTAPANCGNVRKTQYGAVTHRGTTISPPAIPPRSAVSRTIARRGLPSCISYGSRSSPSLDSSEVATGAFAFHSSPISLLARTKAPVTTLRGSSAARRTGTPRKAGMVGTRSKAARDRSIKRSDSETPPPTTITAGS
ncbi:Hypothetical Protein RradSPS_0183 [Rubrobacter radiotolerans]|uniref:Uncharacterized protein n=1 Tax=Rubrobacter radiotolerans TaxID=42256 RepID=A0A023WZT5_RUBRA|nr:Hypothetical Protein RradSPS_0183 [Rubrobacter radiotolerans]